MPVTMNWALSALLVAGFGLWLTFASLRFGYDYEVSEMPVVGLAAGLVLAGLLYCLGLPRLITNSLAMVGGHLRPIVLCIVVGGLIARLALFASEPMLEDDYQRYLWDGAVTASGNNPYTFSPEDMRVRSGNLGSLARESGLVAARINHPDLKTIYPPVAQGAFALAYLAEPWSLAAWRSVLLVFDLASLALILVLLREIGRSPLWSALYWWNPLVIKELFNSAHMEAVVLPFVLAALLLAMRNRRVLASASLAFAVGVKVWPGLLLPVVLRSQSFNLRRCFGSILVFGALIALWVTPIWLGGLDQSSGFVAYLSDWQTNSALFPSLVSAIGAVLDRLALPPETAGSIARGMIALILVALSVAVSLKPIEGPDDLIGRASLVVAVLVLLSPAQFPWYAVWFAPFLPFRPWFGFLLLTATAPLYYLSFYFLSRHRPEIFDGVIVWIIWIPVWAALALEVAQRRRARAVAVAANV
jgi:alpha-1,6-mannosyltransferase